MGPRTGLEHEGVPQMSTNTSRAAERLTTTKDTAGVTVRMTPQGLRRLAETGTLESLRRQIPRLLPEQRNELLKLLSPTLRTQLAGVPAGRARTAGRPPKAPAADSPVAIARAHAGLNKHELAVAAGVRDGAVANIEERGLSTAPTTMARYLAPLGARVEVVVTHRDGEVDRFLVTPESNTTDSR